MKILVVGASSSVGKELIPILNKYSQVLPVTSKDCNVVKQTEVESLLRFNADVDCVINLAATVGGIFDNINRPYDYIYNNTLINSNVIQGCRNVGIKNLMSISSTCVYPDVLDDSFYPLTEECVHLGKPPESNLGYAYAKRLMMFETELCNQQYGTNFTYLIPSNLYGYYSHYDDSAHFLGKLIHKIHQYNTGKIDKIEMMGGSSGKRQYLFVEDLCKIISKWVSNAFPIMNCNVAPNENITIKEITDTALKVCGCKAEVKFSTDMVGQVRRDVSNEKLLKIRNVKFTILEDGIKLIYEKMVNDKISV